MMSQVIFDSPMTVKMTEQTLRELLKAIEKAKNAKGDRVLVESHYSNVKFLISIETKPKSMESLGYIPTQVFYPDRDAMSLSEELQSM